MRKKSYIFLDRTNICTKKSVFVAFYLRISQKSSNFAGEFRKLNINWIS